MARLTNNENISIPEKIGNCIDVCLIVDKKSYDRYESVRNDINDVLKNSDADFMVCVYRKQILGGGWSDSPQYILTTVYANFKISDVEVLEKNGAVDGYVVSGKLKRMFFESKFPMVSDKLFKFSCYNILRGNYKITSFLDSTYIEITEKYDDVY